MKARERNFTGFPDASERVAFLSDAAGMLLVAEDPAKYLDGLFDRLAELLNLEVYFHFAVSPDGTSLTLTGSRGVTDEQRRQLQRLEFGQGVCGAVAASRQVMVLTDVQHSTDPITGLIRSLGLTAYVSRPLMADGQLLGTLSFGTRNGTRFSADSLAMLRTVCDYVSVALGRSRTREALLETEQRFGVAISNSPVTVFEQDRGLRYTWIYNPAPEFSAESIVGRTDRDLFGDGASGLEALKLSVLDTGRSVRQELMIPYGGRETWWDIQAEPRRDVTGEITGVICAAVDLTERHEREQQLREFNRQLEERVEARTAALRKQAVRLRNLAAELTAAEQRERRRLASLLHDHLQQLLVAAKLQISNVNATADTCVIDDIRERAIALLEESIDASRDLTRQLRPPVLYEDGLLPALRWLASDLSEKHDLDVSVTGEIQVELESEDLRALLFESVRELLFNIVKYADVSEAAVELRSFPENVLQVVVRDGGRGFDADGLTAAGDEKGFGLFSIRERIAAMGGRVAIESRPGQGTRVSIEVPFSSVVTDREDDLGAAEFDTAHENSSERTETRHAAIDGVIDVLVVDDHAIVREGIAAIIDEEPALRIVGQARDGLEAIELAGECRPDVVLMDVNMPRMNGIEATRQMVRRWPHIIVIGLSVHEDPATAKSMLDAGATGFVAKAGDRGQVVSTIRRLLNVPA